MQRCLDTPWDDMLFERTNRKVKLLLVPERCKNPECSVLRILQLGGVGGNVVKAGDFGQTKYVSKIIKLKNIPHCPKLNTVQSITSSAGYDSLFQVVGTRG